MRKIIIIYSIILATLFAIILYFNKDLITDNFSKSVNAAISNYVENKEVKNAKNYLIEKYGFNKSDLTLVKYEPATWAFMEGGNVASVQFLYKSGKSIKCEKALNNNIKDIWYNNDWYDNYLEDKIYSDLDSLFRDKIVELKRVIPFRDIGFSDTKYNGNIVDYLNIRSVDTRNPNANDLYVVYIATSTNNKIQVLERSKKCILELGKKLNLDLEVAIYNDCYIVDLPLKNVGYVAENDITPDESIIYSFEYSDKDKSIINFREHN